MQKRDNLKSINLNVNKKIQRAMVLIANQRRKLEK